MSRDNPATPWSPEEDDLQPGTVLADQYELVGLFGVGGFATVYEAIQLNIERPVAIKLIHQPKELGGANRERNLARFILEAKAAARIDHPNVVTVYDIGLIPPDRPFIVMQPFNGGHTLEDELHEHGAMTFSRLQPLMVDVLDALSIAHEKGIIHRDLKPDNLVLVYRGTRREMIKLIDFGIARLEWVSFRLTLPETRAGNPRYLAPEYIRDGTVSPAVDVYQMGLTLVEMLTGRPVVLGNVYHCIMQHLSGELKIPPGLMKTPLGEVLRRALANDPEERFPDAGSFRDALEKIKPETVTWQADGDVSIHVGSSDLPEGMDLNTPILSEGEIFEIQPVPMVEGPLQPEDSRASSARITVPERAVAGPPPDPESDPEPAARVSEPSASALEPAVAIMSEPQKPQTPPPSRSRQGSAVAIMVALVLAIISALGVGIVVLSMYW